MKRLRSLIVFVIAAGLLSAAVAWQAAPPGDHANNILPVVQNTTPRFWKGNLHTHSFWSDGDDFPEMIADWYKRNGYNFLTLSDHNILSEGQKWIDITPGKGTRELALKKYLDRFGAGWVERRRKDKDEK